MYRLPFISFCRNCLFCETKNGIRDSHEKGTGFGIPVRKKRERGIRNPHPFQSKLVVPHFFSKKEPLTLVSISIIFTIISCNTFHKGQIIGKSMKARIYTFISTEFLFSRHKIDFLRPIVDLNLRSQGDASR